MSFFGRLMLPNPTFRPVQVIDTCHAVGISKKCVRLKPVIVVKG